MDQQWQPYSEPSHARPGQYNNGHATHQQPGPKYGGGQPQTQSQLPVGYTYESYQTPGAIGKAPPTATNSKTMSMISPPAVSGTRDYIGDPDTHMEDADPYNRAKYPTKQSHHSRASSQYLANANEESSAARRYSPMNILSPAVPYNNSGSPNKTQSAYAFPPSGSTSARQSPTRTNNYSSPQQQTYQSPPGKFLLNIEEQLR